MTKNTNQGQPPAIFAGGLESSNLKRRDRMKYLGIAMPQNSAASSFKACPSFLLLRIVVKFLLALGWWGNKIIMHTGKVEWDFPFAGNSKVFHMSSRLHYCIWHRHKVPCLKEWEMKCAFLGEVLFIASDQVDATLIRLQKWKEKNGVHLHGQNHVIDARAHSEPGSACRRLIFPKIKTVKFSRLLLLKLVSTLSRDFQLY